MNPVVTDAIPFGWNTAEPLPHHRYVLPALKRFLPPRPTSVLDVGCGSGALTARISWLGHNVVGVDADARGIELARRSHPQVRFEVLSAYDDFSRTGRIPDVVVALEVIEHLHRPTVFLKNAFEILRPGGALILSTPYHGYLKNMALSVAGAWDRHFHPGRDGGHIKFFSERSMVELLTEAGFKQTVFRNVGRVPLLWKSMVCRTVKPG